MNTILFFFAALLSPKMIGSEPVPIPIPHPRPLEQWVAPYSKNMLGSRYVEGNGSITNPYRGDMTVILNGLPEGGWMHIAAGNYPVECDRNCILRGGRRYSGVSKYATRLWRDERFSWNQNQPVLCGVGAGIWIEDMCLDAMSTNGDAFMHSALVINGTRPRVERVHGMGTSGSWANANECWSFFLVTGEALPNGLVQDCSVSNVKGDYVEGFSASGACWFRRCFVDFPELTNTSAPPFFNGFQGSQGSVFEDCYQTGGFGYFYTDTESYNGTRIIGGRARKVMTGVSINVRTNEVADGITVQNTVIEFSTNCNRWACGVAVSGPGTIRNVTVIGSTFKYVGSVHGPDANTGEYGLQAIAINNGSGTRVIGNAIDSDFRIVTEPLQPGANANNTVTAHMPLPTEPIR